MRRVLFDSVIAGYDLNTLAALPTGNCMAISPGGILYVSTGDNTARNVTGSNGTFSRKQAYALNLATGEVTDWKPGDVGSAWTGTTQNPSIQSMCIGSDGYVYASLICATPAYGSNSIQGTSVKGICRFDPTTGVLDTSWTFTGHSSGTYNLFQHTGSHPNRISADGAGNIYWCASQFTNGAGQVLNVYVIAENTAALVRTHTCNGVANQVSFDGAGNYFVGGDFTNIDATTRRQMAQFNSSGTLQTLPAPAANPLTELRSLTYGHGRLYYAGYDPNNVAGLAAWDITGNARVTGFAPDFNEGTTGQGFHGVHCIPMTIDGIDCIAAVGGVFMVGNALRAIYVLVRASDGALLKTPYDGRLQTLDSTDGRDVAYWSATRSFYITAPLTPGIRRSTADTGLVANSIPFRAFQVGLSTDVYKTIAIGSKLYCFGSFTNAVVDKGSPGYGTNKAATADYARGMICFDLTTGHIDTGFAVGLAGVDAGKFIAGAALSQDGTKFHIAGNFTSIHGTTRKGIASINVSDGTLDGGWIPDPSDGSVAPTYGNLEAHGGLLFVSRLNQESPATGVFKVHVYTDTNPPVLQATQNVNSVTVQPRFAVDGNGKYYITGGFTQANATARKGIARYSAADVFDTGFNPAISGGTSIVNDVIIDGNIIYFVGSFSSFATATRYGLGAWNWSTDALDGFHIQANAVQFIFAVLKHTNGNLLLLATPTTGLDDGNGNFTFKSHGLLGLDASGYQNPTWFTGSYLAGPSARARIEYIASIDAFVYSGDGGAGGYSVGNMRIFCAEQ